MNRSTRTTRAAIALIAATAVGVLTGCTAQPTTTPAVGATAKPAAVQEFACPTSTEVAALTATPFSSRTAGAGACSYATGADVSPSSSVTVQRLSAGDARTAAALRFAAMRRGAVTTDLPALSFDAFTSSTSTSCAAWFPVNGVPTSVTARQDGVSGAKECGVAGAVATLVGTGSSASAAPTVAVLAQRRLLGTTTADATWPWRIGRDAGVRIDRATATGYLSPSSTTSLTAAAAKVPTDSAAVVLVSGTAEAGASKLEVLSAATAALSAASGRAPKAKLFVVGPVATGTTSFAELEELRADLQSAATIAGAVYIDPADDGSTASGSAAALTSVAAAVTAELQNAGVGRG
jgi:hypothetical protein